MVNKCDANEIRNLINELNMYTEAYDAGKPIISDREWDVLYFTLVKLEAETGIYYEDSPTQKIYFQEVSKLNKVEHNHPMLSLDKTKEVSEIESFIRNKDFIAMSKLDGLTCSLRYLDGKLIGAETRGNGIIGEDILHNALVIKSIPNKIAYDKELIIDGEIICTYDNFEKFSNDYKNPRNFASGSIRLLDSEECSTRNLTFVAWDVIKGLDEDVLMGKLNTLNLYGFITVPFYFGNDNVETIVEYIKDKSQKLSYPIDGVSIMLQEEQTIILKAD